MNEEDKWPFYICTTNHCFKLSADNQLILYHSFIWESKNAMLPALTFNILRWSHSLTETVNHVFDKTVDDVEKETVDHMVGMTFT